MSQQITLSAFAQPIKKSEADNFLWVPIGPVVSAGIFELLASQDPSFIVTSAKSEVGTLIDSQTDRPSEMSQLIGLMQAASIGYSKACVAKDSIQMQTHLLQLKLLTEVLRYFTHTKPDGSFLNHVVVRWAQLQI